MTWNEVKDLKPGFQLDRVVGIKIFGLKDVTVDELITLNDVLVRGKSDLVGWSEMNGMNHFENVPRWSRNLDGALGLVEYLRPRYFKLEHIIGFGWLAVFDSFETHHRVKGETAAHAICLAALHEKLVVRSTGQGVW